MSIKIVKRSPQFEIADDISQYRNHRKNKYRRFYGHEVRYKVELLSNQLQTQQLELEESRNRLSDLYDYAPTGYLTLDRAGNILSVNSIGASLLRKAKHSLLGQLFIDSFLNINQEVLIKFIQEAFDSPKKTTIDLQISNNYNQESFVRLESMVTNDKNTCHMLISDISQYKRMIVINRNLLDDNRKLIKELFNVQEKERRILARELHDELGQWLTAIRAENEVIFNLTNEDLAILSSVHSIKECTEKMHQVIRAMLHRLRPLLLDSLGLPEALLELKKQWNLNHPYITLELELQGDLATLHDQLNITIFRIIQEGLNNICKHSKATWAQVSLCRETKEDSATDFLLLKIKDNGKGYDVNQKFMGFGLLGIRERVIGIDGSVAIRSAHNEGAEINISLPISI